MIKNPITNRNIKIKGKTYIKLLQIGYYYDKPSNMLVKPKDSIIQEYKSESKFVLTKYKNTEKFIHLESGFIFDKDSSVIGKLVDNNFYSLDKKDLSTCKKFNFYCQESNFQKNSFVLDENKYAEFLEEEKIHLEIFRNELKENEIKDLCFDRMINLFLQEINNNYILRLNNTYQVIQSVNSLYNIYLSKSNNYYGLVNYHGKNCIESFKVLENLFVNFCDEKQNCFDKKECFLKFFQLFLEILRDINNNFEQCLVERKMFSCHRVNRFFEIFEIMEHKVINYVKQKNKLIKILFYGNISFIKNNFFMYIPIDQIENKLEKYFVKNGDVSFFELETFYIKLNRIISHEKEMINFLGELNIKVPIPENDEKQFDYDKTENINLFMYYIDSIKKSKKITEKIEYFSQFITFFLQMLSMMKKEIIINYSEDHACNLINSLYCQLTYFSDIKKYFSHENFKLMLLLRKFSDCEIKEDDDVSKKKCNLCFVNQSIIALLPCGHKYTCSDCTSEIISSNKICPICRKEIVSFVRVFDD